MKLCRPEIIDTVFDNRYTGVNGKDRFLFGPVARLLN